MARVILCILLTCFLIDLKFLIKLKLAIKKDFVADKDDILVSTFSTKSFYSDKVSFYLDLEKEKEEMTPLHLDNDSTSDREINHTAQTTERTEEETQEANMQDS